MKKDNFEQLIRVITGRNLIIKTSDDILKENSEYFIYKELPITKSYTGFIFKTPKKIESFLRTFITQFTSKFREPNPKAYNYTYGGKEYKWSNLTEKEIETAHYHHASNMFSKTQLLEQIEQNFNSDKIQGTFTKYGFYSTEYGIGIFCFYATIGVINAIKSMNDFLNKNNIPFKNEYSDARWVLRFKLGLTKEQHNKLIEQFSK